MEKQLDMVLDFMKIAEKIVGKKDKFTISTCGFFEEAGINNQQLGFFTQDQDDYLSDEPVPKNAAIKIYDTFLIESSRTDNRISINDLVKVIKTIKRGFDIIKSRNKNNLDVDFTTVEYRGIKFNEKKRTFKIYFSG